MAMEERPWSSLLPLILEHVGNILEQSRPGDLLRARVACKHWHACLTRCIKRLILYGAVVPLPNTSESSSLLSLKYGKQYSQQERQQKEKEASPSAVPKQLLSTTISPSDPASLRPCYARHAQLIPSLAPTIRHVTIRGLSCDLDGLRALAYTFPSLTTLSLEAFASYPAAPPPELQLIQRGSPEAGLSTPAPSSLELVPTASRWPPAPLSLETLWIRVHTGVPADVLHMLLLPPQPPKGSAVWPPQPLQRQQQQQQQQQQEQQQELLETSSLPTSSNAHPASTVAAVAAAERMESGLDGKAAALGMSEQQRGAISPLRELGLLPQRVQHGGWVDAEPAPPIPYIDLSPLLDPRLAGVTRLVIPAMTSRVGQHQQHHGAVLLHGQQFGAGLGSRSHAIGAGALGLEEVVGRMTQLRSLTVLGQVELSPFYPACLAALTGLRALHLPEGVYCEGAADLRQLTGLSLLTALELNFESEWWIYAGDLCLLSRLAHLRQLQLSLDYGLEGGCSVGGSDGEDDGDEEGREEEEEEELEGVMDKDDANAQVEQLAEWLDAGANLQQKTGCCEDEPAPHGVLERHRQQQQHGGRDDVGSSSHSAAGDGRFKTVAELARALSSAWRCGRGRAQRVLLTLQPGHPGSADDWRVPLSCLTQLRTLELRLTNGGGRHLAEAMCAATWLTVARRESGTAATDACGGGSGSGASCSGGEAEAEAGGGASLTLQDAPAATFLDVPYWFKVASAASAVPVPLVPRGVFRAPPLVSLHLGSGRALRLSYWNLLCLGLMTDLRSLELSFEAALSHVTASPTSPSRGSSAAVIAAGRSGGELGGASTLPLHYDNPLLALRRLRVLRELKLRIKQVRSSAGFLCEMYAGRGSDHTTASESCTISDSGHVAATASATIDDDVVQAWLEGMPSLQTMALRGVGRLSELALSALGRHSSLRSLELRLKVLPPPPQLLPPPSPSRRKRQRVVQSGAAGNPYGSCGGSGSARPRIGYGSYYGLRTMLPGHSTAAAGGSDASAGGGSGDRRSYSGGVTPAGTSPRGLESYPHMQQQQQQQQHYSQCSTTAWVHSGHVREETHVSVAWAHSGGTGSAAGASVPSTEEAGAAACQSRDWRERLLAEGIEGDSGLLADVPYFVRPHHLPSSLTSLDLTNAAFSAEWAYIGPGGVSDGGVVAPTPACSGVSALHEPWVSAAKDPSEPVQWPGPRLVSLKLARKLPKCRRQGRPAAESAGHASALAAASLDPTRITDWHLVFLTAYQPTLAHLDLYDTDGDSGAGDVAKLHYRALAALGKLSYLESLTLRVGNRLRWRAQEALFAFAPAGLRSLHLHAAHVYGEAVEMASRMPHLSSLRVVGYTEPSYVDELQAAGDRVARHLPACNVFMWFRDVEKWNSSYI